MNNQEELIVPANVPAQVLEIPNSNFNLNYNNDLVTHVKLRVFYQGLTRDKRLFTEEFSNRLLASLPQTPVVGYWDESTEDFLGHNHTQFIYGYVPENAKFGFEIDPDGNKWAVTEIILFTGRGDNIGKVAQKIIGKKHSLELDSGTMKYSVKRNPDGQMQHIELQDGKFVGLSVLGDNQTPAFEGSAFFTDKGIKTCELGKCVQEVKEKYSTFLSNTDKQIGGEEVNTEQTKQVPSEILSELKNFMRVTEDEMAKGIMEATYGKFGQNIFVVQWSSVDDMIVFMDMADGCYYRVKFYMTGDDTIEMGDKMKVKPRFLTEQEIDMVFPETPEEQAESDARIEKNKEEMQQDIAQATEIPAEGDKDAAEEPKVEEPKVEEVVPEPVPQVVEEPVVIPVEVVEEQPVPEAEVKEDDEKKPEGIFITEGQREQIENDRKELEAFRKEKKLGIIEKYSEYLSKDEKSVFSNKVDEYAIDNLEAELAKIAMQKVLKQKTENNVVGTYGFRSGPRPQQNLNSDGLASLVERYKGKK